MAPRELRRGACLPCLPAGRRRACSSRHVLTHAAFLPRRNAAGLFVTARARARGGRAPGRCPGLAKATTDITSIRSQGSALGFLPVGPCRGRVYLPRDPTDGASAPQVVHSRQRMHRLVLTAWSTFTPTLHRERQVLQRVHRPASKRRCSTLTQLNSDRNPPSGHSTVHQGLYVSSAAPSTTPSTARRQPLIHWIAWPRTAWPATLGRAASSVPAGQSRQMYNRCDSP